MQQIQIRWMRGIFMTKEEASISSERSRTGGHIVKTCGNATIANLQSCRIDKENRSPSIGIDPIGEGLTIMRKLTGPRRPLRIRYPLPCLRIEIKQGHIVIAAL